MTTPIADKTVFITGATSGIGRALALRFSKTSVKLVLCGRSHEKLTALVAELKANGATVIFARAFDMLDSDAVREFIADAAGAVGAPDILINNAGANLGKATVVTQDIAAFDTMLALNCRSQLVCTQACHPLMAAAGGGHVVNIISTTALFSNEGVAGYTASKAAFDAWTKIYRKEARADNIRVTAVYPGGTDTPFRTNARPDYMKPETVAEAVYQAVVLPVDGAIHELVLRPMAESNF